ncbi:MAG TPA: hypothetical protein VJB94_05185 [Candidatus Nanoarchaeia archaeon]|nr:hypothetical protein [Candidatus Nanoarchaeia archaeon]
MNKKLDKLDKEITCWMKEHGTNFLRYSLAAVFIWFGILKPLNLSPASQLVTKTVYWFDPSWFVPLLGWWEVAIGLCLLYKPLIRTGLFLMAVQMIGTFLPLIILPDVVYGANFFDLTLEGQYVVKNLVLIGAGMVIASHVRDRC